MPATRGLNHIAVSVPPGTLTPAWRAAFLDLYGAVLGWTEIDNGPRTDRFTVATGGSCYLNIRERDQPMSCTGYEHFGLVVDSPEDLEALWAEVGAATPELVRDEIDRRPGGMCSFKFRHLLPMTGEIQYLPPGTADASPRPWRR
jgi:hypothetical protein